MENTQLEIVRLFIERAHMLTDEERRVIVNTIRSMNTPIKS